MCQLSVYTLASLPEQALFIIIIKASVAVNTFHQLLAHMFDEVTLDRILLATKLAAVGFVCAVKGLDVLSQVAPVCKTFAALTALVRLLSCVSSHMTLQQPFPGECLGATGYLALPAHRMSLHVYPEGSPVAVLLVAHCTLGHCW